jgi:hypothetical protein
MNEILFNSNQDFYEFVERLSADLSELGFSGASRELQTILHEMAWTTSSEVFGEIKMTLQRLKLEEGKRLPQHLSEDVELCIKSIEDAWSKASR